jgi:hypothetical protein
MDEESREKNQRFEKMQQDCSAVLTDIKAYVEQSVS